MPHPVFISVASEDVDYARKIKEGFSDDTAYFYEKTGIEGADWPKEIEEEVQFCECFVILWSANYIQKNWTLRELAIAAKRIASKTLRSWLIIQIDDTSLSPRLINPLTSLNEDLLSSFRAKYRSVGLPFRVTAAQRAVDNALARVKPPRLPILARTELQDQLRQAFSINFRERNPLTFVSGLNGTGRKTLVKCVMESDFRHLTPHLVTLEVADGPDDLLLKLWLDVLNVPSDEVRRQLNAFRKGKLSAKVLTSTALKNIATNRGYLIINIDIPNDYVSPIPAWVNECFNNLSIGVAPILFLVIPRRIPDHILADFHHTALIHVPTLEQHESRDLTFRLIQSIDLHPTRWTEKHESSIVKRGGGNPELIQKLVIMACRQSSLDFIEHQLDPVVEHFLEYLGEWVEHSLTHLGAMREEGILLLSIIDRLGIADLAALSDARLSLSKVASASVGEVLYNLSNIGLIEQLNGGVFRIPPLVRMKINFHLNKGELGKTVDQCLHKFAEHPLDLGRDENGATFILNALEAKLLTDIELTEQENAYVSAALMFRAGLQRYWRGDYFHAYSLLQRVFNMRATVNNEDVRLEITRYFGLAAIREERDWHDVEFALKNEFTQSRYKQKSDSMYHFLKAFSCRLNGEYDS
ncbi:MAG: toll/interleukin-1 receptor domain-containing protein, partial [Methylococcales bacterium]|nr:toll/interleukin-1 receptor domain-containing protein [Methylococcales bacterium]